MAFPKSLKQLCTPAYIYFILSVICIIIMIIQNIGNRGILTLGSMSVPVPSTALVLVIKVIAVLFWTWVLNLMCKDGHKEIAWFLVLLPFLLLFFMLGTAEGFQAKDQPAPVPGICKVKGDCERTLNDHNLCKSDACKEGTGRGCPSSERCGAVIKDLEICKTCPKS